MENEKKVEIVDKDYYNQDDIVIQKTQKIVTPEKEVVSSVTYGDLKQRLADLQQARIDKINAIDLQIAEVQHDLELAEPQIAKVEIKETPIPEEIKLAREEEAKINDHVEEVVEEEK